MSGPLPDDPALAFGQIESIAYLRNKLPRNCGWASMDYNVELRTPLVDAHQLQPLMGAFARFPGKSLLAGAPARGLPAEIAGRRKTGFGIPVGRWIEQAKPGDVGAGTRAWGREIARAYAGSGA